MEIIQNPEIQKIIEHIKNGLVLVFPTDTVYGLIADASNKEAVERIFAIKERPNKMKLPVFIGNIELAKELAEINIDQEEDLYEKWPGPYTFVLKRINYPKELFGLDDQTIALRIPNYPLLQDILEKINTPIVQTSANISGFGATAKIGEVIEQFSNQEIQPDIIVDVGDLPDAKPSTIIDLTDQSKILRS
jgi:L-threonylcarbamoyladenylate synthase